MRVVVGRLARDTEGNFWILGSSGRVPVAKGLANPGIIGKLCRADVVAEVVIKLEVIS